MRGRGSHHGGRSRSAGGRGGHKKRPATRDPASKRPAKKRTEPEEEEDLSDFVLSAEIESNPYSALLSSLKSSGGAHARLISQRLKEQQGHDSGESSSEEEEEGDDGDDENFENFDEEGKLEMEEDEEAAAAARIQAGSQATASAPEAREGKDKAKARAQGPEEADDVHIDVQGMIEEKKRKEEEALTRLDEDGTTRGRGEDPYGRHMSAVLDEKQIASLSRSAPRFHPLPSTAPLNQWPNATWLTDHDPAALPASFPALSAPLPASLEECHVKERLLARWRDLHGGSAGFEHAQQAALFQLLAQYQDVLMPAHAYPLPPGAPEGRNPIPGGVQPPDFCLDAVLLHVLNHCAKTSDRIKKNNALAEKIRTEGLEEDPPRDQGFTRPKAMFLLPMRNRALSVVSRLLELAIRETRKDSIQRKDKFIEEFGADPEEEGEGDAPGGKRKAPEKPSEHRALFSGNLDDHFRLGLKITRGAVRLYSDLTDSDILFMSPLGLLTKIEEEAKNKGDGGLDFLSSIEILVIDRADVIKMQNWQHLVTALEGVNRQPEKHMGSDIMRLREWYLSGLARHYRQTIVLSSFATPEVHALFARTAQGHGGRWKLKVEGEGVLGQVHLQVRQLFTRIHSATPAEDADARFDHFARALWPRMKESGAPGQLLFVPSYFDFVRIRNFLVAQKASFVAVSEYSKKSDVTRSRAYFFQGRRNILLYTERAHFYNRYRIRGIRDLTVYSLPDHAQYYPELVNLLEGSAAAGGAAAAAAAAAGAGHATVQVLFSKWEALALERVVGAARAKKMIKQEGNTYMFV